MVLQLRPYQEDMVSWLVEHERALNYDQPGMGKTLEGIEAAVIAVQRDMERNELTEPRQILVVCPGYLVEQWVDAIKDQYPTHTVSWAEPRAPAGVRMLSMMKRAQWIVVNKEMLRQYPVPTDRFAVMILDEAHHFRNHEAQQSKGALAAAREIPYVFELTATPVKKEADDLFMLFKILEPDKFTSYWQFVNTYMFAYSTNGYGTKVSGVRRPVALKQLLGLKGKGRTYKDVALQIPKLIVKKKYAILNEEERKLYDMIRIYWRNQEKTYSNFLAAMQALRRVTACEDKFDVVQNICEDSDGPVIIFCWYHTTAKKLSKLLDCPMITGNTPQEERPKIAKQGTHIVATIPSLSEGVDLSHSHEVVFIEEDYTPGSRVQALARVRRWSASNDEDPTPVVCHYVMVKNSIDEVVHRAVEGRVASLDTIIETEYLRGEEVPSEKEASLV